MVTNGEHNSLRMQGNTRPLHILQVRSEARAKIAKKQPKILLAMLTPKGIPYYYYCKFENSLFLYFVYIVKGDGTVTAEYPDPAVSNHTLCEVLEWRRSGVDTSEVVDRLRAKTVPAGYPLHPWTPDI